MDRIAVIYWSGTGNTQAMAEAVYAGAQSANPQVDLCPVSDISAADAAKYPKLALGCPAMGAEVLEESEFEPFFTDLEPQLSGKKVALFGSYGWGDGEWMRNWQERVDSAGAALYNQEGLMVHETPDNDQLACCESFGKGFAAY